jgi:hypothetical protein
MNAAAAKIFLARLAALNERRKTFDHRVGEWSNWIEEGCQRDFEEGGDGSLEASDLGPQLAAALQDWADGRLAEADARARRDVGDLRRQLEAERERSTAERRRRYAAVSALKARIAEFEAAAEKRNQQFEALTTQLVSLERSVARDRSLRRMVDARRSYPRADKVALEAARRKTDKAIQGGLNG